MTDVFGCWWVPLESLALGNGLTWSDLQSMWADEFFCHLVESRRREAERMRWELEYARSIGFGVEARSAALSTINMIGGFGIVPSSIYHRLIVSDRLRAIGSALASRGADRWREDNADQLEWLRRNGFSEASAVMEYRRAVEDNNKTADAASEYI